MQILVVEDERRMADLLKQGLEEEGHAVVVSGRGPDALAIAQHHSFDAILLVKVELGHEILFPHWDGLYKSEHRLTVCAPSGFETCCT